MTVIYAVLFIYLALVAFSYFMQRNYIYYPDKSVPNKAMSGVPDMQTIDVATEDNLTLNAWYKAAEGRKPVILMFHGNGGNISLRGFKARAYMDNGYGVLLAEYRGYGGNEGAPTEQGLYADARAYMTWLNAQGIENEDIVLYGESLGTGMAVKMAVEYPDVRAIVLETPFTSFVDLGKKHMIYLPVGLLLKDRYDNLKIIGDVKAPLLIFHGTTDTIVPYDFGQRLYKAANDPKFFETIPMGGHNNLYSFGAGRRVLGFLNGLE